MNTCRPLNKDIKSQPISAKERKIISKNSKIFTMGSCFAIEIQKYLTGLGYNMLTHQTSDTQRDLVWYNTYTMLYEFKRITGEFKQDENDIWQTKHGYQDPYRRCVCSKSLDQLWQKINKIDDDVKRGILEADIIILTLGLTEVFFHNKSGNAMCAIPGYAGSGPSGDDHNSKVKFTSYSENYDNVSTIMDIIHNVNPKCQVILTVSPVPLAKTFSENDQIVANMESKSILRAVAAEIVRNFDFCCYFHSYELAMSSDRKSVYQSDARHINPEFVKFIMTQFTKYFIK